MSWPIIVRSNSAVSNLTRSNSITDLQPPPNVLLGFENPQIFYSKLESSFTNSEDSPISTIERVQQVVGEQIHALLILYVWTGSSSFFARAFEKTILFKKKSNLEQDRDKVKRWMAQNLDMWLLAQERYTQLVKWRGKVYKILEQTQDIAFIKRLTQLFEENNPGTFLARVYYTCTCIDAEIDPKVVEKIEKNPYDADALKTYQRLFSEIIEKRPPIGAPTLLSPAKSEYNSIPQISISRSRIFTPYQNLQEMVYQQYTHCFKESKSIESPNVAKFIESLWPHEIFKEKNKFFMMKLEKIASYPSKKEQRHYLYSLVHERLQSIETLKDFDEFQVFLDPIKKFNSHPILSTQTPVKLYKFNLFDLSSDEDLCRKVLEDYAKRFQKSLMKLEFEELLTDLSEKETPNHFALTRIIFDGLARALQHGILYAKSKSESRKAIESVIKLGEMALRERNFTAAFAINGILESQSVSRLLKKSQKPENLAELCSHNLDYKNYRNALKDSPCIPHLGIFTRDLQFKKLISPPLEFRKLKLEQEILFDPSPFETTLNGWIYHAEEMFNTPPNWSKIDLKLWGEMDLDDKLYYLSGEKTPYKI